MWSRYFVLFVIIKIIICAPQPYQYESEQNRQIYPEDCTYKTNAEDNIELNCTTFKFLEKFGQKQLYKVTSLTMNNCNVEKIDPKLKYLKNLNYLDLSNNNVLLTSIPLLPKLKTLKLSSNNIKYINISSLPPNLKQLDLSSNYLAQIPKDWNYLQSLKILNLYKNPINCDCINVNIHNDIIRNGIICDPVMCHSPNEYVGKLINTINCSMNVFDIMVDDTPIEGSGSSSSSSEEDFITDNENIPYVNDDDDNDTEIIDTNTIINDKLTEDGNLPVSESGRIIEEESGSGEGSGDINIYPDLRKACIINCSSPKPVGQDDEQNASPLPTFIEQVNIIQDDLNIFKDEQKTTTTTTTTSQSPTEPIFFKEHVPEIQKETDKIDFVGDINDNGELGKVAVEQDNSPNTIYTIIGICIVLAICILIFLLQKRKLNQNRPDPQTNDQEMISMNKKLLGKPIYDDQTIKQQPNEHVPLINGNQNGKINDNNRYNDDNNYNEQEPVQLRNRPKDELLTPQRERVTIKETELPDSIPKTPLLVHRQRNSNGDIVLVPSS